MNKLWQDEAWADYLYWQQQDKKLLKRINQLLKDIDRSGYDGIGKPEPLKGDLSGWWSRRIDDTHRSTAYGTGALRLPSAAHITENSKEPGPRPRSLKTPKIEHLYYTKE
jgi:toxin YoeB